MITSLIKTQFLRLRAQLALVAVNPKTIVLGVFCGMALMPLASNAQAIYSDLGMADAGNWTVNNSFGALNNNPIDYQANFGVNYTSTLGVPQDPYSSSTTALQLKVNETSGNQAGVSVSPTGLTLPGNFAMTFDMWLNYNSGGFTTGSTQVGSYGLTTAANQVQGPSGVGSGQLFGEITDNGSATDYRAYNAGNNMGAGPFPLGQNETAYATLFPSVAAPAGETALDANQYGSSYAGTISFQWVQVSVTYSNGVLSESINGNLIASYSAGSVGPDIFLGMYDINNGSAGVTGIADENFVLFDNLVITALPSGPVGQDAAQLISVSITNGTPMMPRTVFTQTWTMQNTGTTTWTPGFTGYTMDIVGEDSLGAMPPSAKTFASPTLSTPIGSGASVAPGAQATFTMSFIAPETAGSVTDSFQLNNASSVFFGPTNTIQIVVLQAGSTNQYDRARAVSYANNYAGFVNSDGYFWTNGSTYGTFTPLSPAPSSGLGDDCAHFVSCCIGSEPHVRGAGLNIPSRVPPTYGEPGAAKLVNNCLIGPGYAVEVFSLTKLSPGDVIGWNWEGDTNIADLDHVTLYLGNGLLAAHSASCLDVSADTWYQSSEPGYVRHLIHILDAPTIAASWVGNNLVLSWGTNWVGYALYSSTNLSAGATWIQVSNSPVRIGKLNVMTNTVSPGAMFYRLVLP